MLILAYLATLIMGMVLGLMGAGGSILTVPILIYGFGLGTAAATGYSLLVVGVVGTFSAYKFLKQEQLNIRAAINFVIPSLIGVYLARQILLVRMPVYIYLPFEIQLTKDDFILVIFAIIMLSSAFSMIRSKKSLDVVKNKKQTVSSFFLVSVLGLAVGVMTGFVGAGGGFLILPVLIHFLDISIKKAVGTSLAIIAINSLVGFSISYYNGLPNHEMVVLSVLIIAILGSFIGGYFSEKINENNLKKIFGYFVLLVGSLILVSKLN